MCGYDYPGGLSSPTPMGPHWGFNMAVAGLWGCSPPSPVLFALFHLVFYPLAPISFLLKSCSFFLMSEHRMERGDSHIVVDSHRWSVLCSSILHPQVPFKYYWLEWIFPTVDTLFSLLQLANLLLDLVASFQNTAKIKHKAWRLWGKTI